MLTTSCNTEQCQGNLYRCMVLHLKRIVLDMEISQNDNILKQISEVDVGNCSCSSYISESGAGLCRTSYIQGPICYVNEPSTCEDLHVSSIENGKRYSWEACKNGTFNLYDLSI